MSPTSNIFAQKCGRSVHIHKKLCNLELCVINVYKSSNTADWQINKLNWNWITVITERSMWTHFEGLGSKLLVATFYDFLTSFQKNVKRHVFLKSEKKRKIRNLEHCVANFNPPKPIQSQPIQPRPIHSTHAWTHATFNSALSRCRPDMELGHWVTGSMGHLSRPGHRVIILTRCQTRVFPVFEKCPKFKTYTFEMLKWQVIVRCQWLDWNHWMSVHAMNLWLLKILWPENTSSHISRHLELSSL